MHTSDERGRYLDFEQTHWKVQVYFTQLEYFIQVLDRKQGDLYQTEKLYNEYKVNEEFKMTDKNFSYREKFMMKNFLLMSKVYYLNSHEKLKITVH